jgi:hypothetical protein
MAGHVLAKLVGRVHQRSYRHLSLSSVMRIAFKQVDHLGSWVG